MDEWSRPAELGEAPAAVSCSASPCVKSIAMGVWHACAVLDDQGVLCWGYRSEGATGQPLPSGEKYVETPTVVAGVAAESVRAGGSNTCVRNGASVSCWGYVNRQDDEADPSLAASPEQLLTREVAQLVVADRHICVLDDDGVPACYGANDFGQLGRQTPRPADYPPDLPELGGYPSFEFLPAHSVSHVTRLDARSDVSCAIDWRGDVSCWGLGISGVLGFGEKQQQPEPVAIPELSDIVDLSVGDFHACAVNHAGDVSCWGKDISGSIGSPDENYFPPRQVAGVSDAAQVACSSTSSCVRTRTGEVWCWGSNTAGQLGSGSADDERHHTPAPVEGVTDVVDLEAADGAFCALKRSGAVLCWGSNSTAALGVGSTDDEPHAPASPSWPEP